MTVVTRGDIWRAQRNSLSVIGFAIVFQTILVAGSTPFVADGFKMTAPDGLNLVGGMAVGADRSPFITRCKKLSVYTFLIGFLNPCMAFSAGFGGVGMVDGGIEIHTALDGVYPMAVRAGGSLR